MDLDNVIFTSFYTRDPIYAKHAEGLMKTLDTFNLKYDIESIESDPTKTWINNVIYKPIYILKKMNQYSCPVVWLDVDARVRSIPELFFECDKDIAFHARDMEKSAPWGRTGTILLNNTDVTKEFIKQWYVTCVEEKCADHIGFNILLRKNKHNMDVQVLPVAYCYIFDNVGDKHRLEQSEWASPVIEHLQASRSRKKIDKLRSDITIR